MVAFICNACSNQNDVPPDQLEREVPSCSSCGSTVRFRATIDALSHGLFGRSLTLEQFPVNPDIRGVGMSDWWIMAEHLAAKFGYENTFYDREPQLDITKPHPQLLGTLDFVISSDVFEHVVPPVAVAFENVYRLLKPGGTFVFTVPYTFEARTVEHFPSLNRFCFAELDGAPVLVNRRVDGGLEAFDNLVFHGGEGLALEMRIFALNDLIGHLRAAGFGEVEILDSSNDGFGIRWTSVTPGEPSGATTVLGAPILARRKS